MSPLIPGQPHPMPDSGRAEHPVSVPVSWRTAWLIELVRLRETLWGPLDDRLEVVRVQAAGGTLPDRIAARARFLGEREGLQATLEAWVQGARLALVLVCLLSVGAACGAAAGALGTGARPVNVLLALVALLGLNLATLLFWCAGVLVQPGQSSWLATAWLGLSKRLARGPDAALAPRALLGVLSRQSATRWVSGVLSHGVWLLVTLAMVLTLVALLAARRYTFNWETTLLDPDTFVGLGLALGALPARLGFTVPDADLIRISDGLHALPAAAQVQWSGWLLGCVLVYGLLPRVCLFVLCLVMARKRLRVLAPDTALPGLVELQDRLMPARVRGTAEAPPPDVFQSQVATGSPGQAVGSEATACVGLDWPADASWPPLALPADVTDLGVIAGRAERNAVLSHLQHHRTQRLLVVCDAHQTPDRGTLALLSELAAQVPALHVWLAHLPESGGASPARLETWYTLLLQAGFETAQYSTRSEQILQWLKPA